jgi:hypothetical protein
VPAVIPVSTPALEIVASVDEPTLQVPPVAVLLRLSVPPSHTLVVALVMAGTVVVRIVIVVVADTFWQLPEVTTTL